MIFRKSKTRLIRSIYIRLLVFGLLLGVSAAQADILDYQRVELQDGIVHYTFDVDLGPDEFDTVRLHRIVREKREGKPVATIDGVFMLPGAPNFFEMIFDLRQFCDAAVNFKPQMGKFLLQTINILVTQGGNRAIFLRAKSL